MNEWIKSSEKLPDDGVAVVGLASHVFKGELNHTLTLCVHTIDGWYTLDFRYMFTAPTYWTVLPILPRLPNIILEEADEQEQTPAP